MTDAASAKVVHLSNAQASDLPVWLEPWCDELKLPPRGRLTLIASGGESPEIESTEDNLVVYGAAGTRLHVEIDGIAQDTGSAELTVPGTGSLSTRATVQIMFGGIAEMRPCGEPVPPGRSRWSFVQRLFSRGSL